MRVTVEGEAGGGKTTVAVLVAKALLDAGFDAKIGTTGEDLNAALLSAEKVAGVAQDCGEVVVRTRQQPRRIESLEPLDDPASRTRDPNGTLYSVVSGILVGFTHVLQSRDGWVDMITPKQARKEVRALLLKAARGEITEAEIEAL